MTNPDSNPGSNPGPSWPLFVVAGLGFVPFAGILFGSVGAGWGLISSRRKAMLAALIGACGALLNMGFIMVVGFSSAGKAGGLGAIWRQEAENEMLTIVVALEKYHDTEHAYPQTLYQLPGHTGALRLVGLMDQSAGPFHATREYTYRVAADGESYDIFAVGADGKMGTADDIRPVLPDSVKHSGFRPVLPGEPK